MKERLLDKFYWNDRNDFVNTKLALYIGNKLLNGNSVAEALEKASFEIENNKRKLALIEAADLIKEGRSIGDALYSSRVRLSKKDGYVLSLPITSIQKGRIMKTWSESRYSNSDFINYLIIVYVALIFFIASFPIVPFVLPQFREILYSFDITKSNSLIDIFCNSSFLLLIFSIFFMLISTIIILHFFFNKKEQMQEEADFIGAISSVNNEDQIQLLNLIINPICFPRNYKKFSRILNSIESGGDIHEAIRNSGVSSYLEWLLQLSFFDKDRSVLKEGSIIINERIMLYSLSSIKIIEVIVVILESLVFLLIAYVLYGSMNALLTGCIASS